MTIKTLLKRQLLNKILCEIIIFIIFCLNNCFEKHLSYNDKLLAIFHYLCSRKQS